MHAGGAPDVSDLVLFHEGEEPQARIVPGHRWRPWSDGTFERFANRCLPLLMANQAGWVVLNPAAFTAAWNGGDDVDDLTVQYSDGTPGGKQLARSHFGYGIITFSFLWAFVTPRGYNLLARGPANSPKDGVAPLEGLVETDWAVVPFTMNWKLTRPGSVAFAEDEAIMQLVPQRRGELETFQPRLRSIDHEPALRRRFRSWGAVRAMFEIGRQASQKSGDGEWKRIWQSDYFKGRTPTGETSPEHQTTIRLAAFDR